MAYTAQSSAASTYSTTSSQDASEKTSLLKKSKNDIEKQQSGNKISKAETELVRCAFSTPPSEEENGSVEGSADPIP